MALNVVDTSVDVDRAETDLNLAHTSVDVDRAGTDFDFVSTSVDVDRAGTDFDFVSTSVDVDRAQTDHYAALTTGADVDVSNQVGPQSEVGISVNPLNPLNIVAASNDIADLSHMETYFSTDGGTTWTTVFIDENQ